MSTDRGVGAVAGLRARPGRAPLAVAAAGAGACLVVGLVDPARTPLFPPCPFKALTGLDCPGCGATRAVHHLLSGDVAAALGFNVVAVLAVPLVLWWWAAWALPVLGGPAISRPSVARGVWPWLIGALVAFAVVRNLPMEPFRALGT